MTRWFIGLGLVCCLTARAHADSPLQIARSDERIRVDGALREWRGARFVSLGSGEGALRYTLATRDGGLYLAAEVADPRVIRSRGVGRGQDALVLTLAMPTRRGGWVATDIWLHPGVTGTAKADAGAAVGGGRPRSAPGIKVVEGPREGKPGYVIEAFIPWKAVRESDLWQMGRGALRYENADRRGKAKVSAATARARTPGGLPMLAMGQGQLDLVRAFLKAKGMGGVDPRFDLKGDVQGDGRAERVTLADRYVVVSGPDVHEGKSYGYMELPIGVGGSLHDARLMDLTGDRKAELVVTLKQQNRLGSRRVWTVIDLSGGNPRRVFGVELEKRTRQGSLTAKLALEKPRRGRPRGIVVRRGKAQGLDAESYKEAPAEDVRPILLPWGLVSKQVYRYRGGKFVLENEDRDPAPKASAAAAPEPEERSAEPAKPAPPSLQAIVEAAKQQAGIGAGRKPDHHLHANVAGGKGKEHVYVFGAQLIVVGPDIGGGQSYFSYGLPVPEPEDLRAVRGVDLNRDGRQELLLRVHQALGNGIERELLIVQRFTRAGFKRALNVEVARWQGKRRIANQVSTRGGVLRIGPGKARGWSAGDYPFPDEGVGGAGRLLLPWKDSVVTYRLTQGQLRH